MIDWADLTKKEPQLKKYFEMVTKNNGHWKNPIDCILKIDEDDLRWISEAIVFYTGSVPEFTKVDNHRIRIRADGYYLTIGS